MSLNNDKTSNFYFLAEHDPLFVEIAVAAERAFSSDPNTTLFKLRQLGEALAQHIAVYEWLHAQDDDVKRDAWSLIEWKQQQVNNNRDAEQTFGY